MSKKKFSCAMLETSECHAYFTVSLNMRILDITIKIWSQGIHVYNHITCKCFYLQQNM